MMAFLARWVAFLAVSAAAVLLLTSQLFEQADPELALELNPVSTEARIKLAVKQLTATPPLAEKAKQTAAEGLKLHRLDARFLSLAGLAAQIENKPEEAAAYFQSSLVISPTEFQALSAMLRLDLEAGRVTEAVNRLDLLTRRWGAQNEVYLPLIPAIVSTPVGLDTIRTVFSVPSARRDLVLKGLLAVDGAVVIASELVAYWAKANVPNRANLVNQVTAKLLTLKQDQAAYLYHLSYGGIDENDDAYIKNGNFSKKSDRSPFDWAIQKQRGVNLTINENVGAQIQFLDSPVQFENLSQLTALAPGKHVLHVEYGTQYLKTPTPVRAEVRCRSGKLLGSITLAGATNALAKFSTEFEVPRNDCVLQKFALSSDKLPESWQNRYSGKIIVRAVSIERTGQ
jgi:tetratricopeptide (TPR) repeat protein